MIIGHGGNKTALAKTLGCPVDDIIDMSSNLNPLGPPANIEKFLCDNIFKIRSLPEPDAFTIRKKFAKFHKIDHKNVVAGNGTTWFIHIIPKALKAKKVLIAGPTYSDYKDACHNGIAFKHYLAKDINRFEPDIDDISKMADNADTVFICNPNNPTGSLVLREKLEFLIKKHKTTCFVIDESYLPFVDMADEVSLVSRIGHSKKGYKNLVVLSSMSKIFKIPGLRTGFLIAADKLVKKVMAYYQPWSVNALAQAVIEHIFDHPLDIEKFYQKTRTYIKTEKQIFLKSLKHVQRLHLFDSNTYFILARLTAKMNSKDFCNKIGKNKILIRDCSNFFGLSDQYVRFSLLERQHNKALTDLIKTIMKND